MTRSFLIRSSIPYWVDALYAAVYTIDWLPMPILQNKSPFEILFEKMADYNFLKPFGCACFPNFVDSSSNKLKPRYIECVFLGCEPHYRGYRCLDPKTGRVYITCDV